MDIKRIFDKIDDLYEQYLSVWEDVCNIESPTDFKPGVDAVGAYFLKMASARGWETDVLPQSVSGDALCITMCPDADGAPICFSAHMDTVHAVGSFGTPAVHFDDEKIYGPGVSDCKGGAVAAFMAMDALEKCGFNSRPIRLILQSDEETGSRQSKLQTVKYMCDMAKDAVAFLNLECYYYDKACIARKGIINFKFTVSGIAAHSSKCAVEGANAIIEAAYKMIELDKIKDKDGLTCNCAVISGGSANNIVPEHCEFSANVRFANEEQLKWIRDHVKKIAEDVHVPGCRTTVVENGFRPAMELSDKNLALLDKLNEIFSEVGIPTVKGYRGSGGSDAAYVTSAGITCLDSLGVTGFNEHSKDECALKISLKESAKRLSAIACKI